MAAFNILSTAPPSVILNPQHPQYSDAVAGIFKLGGVEYLKKQEVAHIAVGRKDVSACWKYGVAIVRKNDKKQFYYCFDCESNKKTQPLLALCGTSPARYHMKNVHSRDPETGDKLAKDAVIGAVYQLVEQKNYNTFKALLIRWFVCCQLAFFMLENTIFRDLIVYLNAALGGFLPKARSTLRTWIMAEYDSQKEALKEELKASDSKVHISFDIWTAGSWIGIISL